MESGWEAPQFFLRHLIPSALVLARRVCLGLNEKREERRLDGSEEESKVTGMASSILGTAENFPQILAFCVLMLSHSYVFKVTQPRYLTVFIFSFQ